MDRAPMAAQEPCLAVLVRLGLGVQEFSMEAVVGALQILPQTPLLPVVPFPTRII